MNTPTTSLSAASITQSPKLTIENGHPTANSLEVAQYFERRHDNIIQAIESMDVPETFHKLNFQETETTRPNPLQQCAPLKSKSYNMTKDGFTLLVMGFTGKKALQFKIDYIEAFNMMEEQIRSQEQLTFQNAQPKQFDLPHVTAFPQPVQHTFLCNGHELIVYVEKNGNKWFQVSGIGKILGYCNPHAVVIKRIGKEHVRKFGVLVKNRYCRVSSFIDTEALTVVITRTLRKEVEALSRCIREVVLPKLNGMAETKKQLPPPQPLPVVDPQIKGRKVTVAEGDFDKIMILINCLGQQKNDLLWAIKAHADAVKRVQETQKCLEVAYSRMHDILFDLPERAGNLKITRW